MSLISFAFLGVIYLIMSLSNGDNDGGGNEEGKKVNRFRLVKTTTRHVLHAFLYISLPSLYVYDVKLPNLEDGNTRQ